MIEVKINCVQVNHVAVVSFVWLCPEPEQPQQRNRNACLSSLPLGSYRLTTSSWRGWS
jgi:hypothetical protein